MSGADVEVLGLQEVIALVGQDLRPVLDAAVIAVAEAALDVTRPYPGVRRQKQPFRSAAQRRGFFARLRSGKIKVPYRRSGDTLARWVPEPQAQGVRYRNTKRSAQYVHSADDQARYHAGNWKTDKEGADTVEQNGTAARLVEDALVAAFGRES